MKNIKLPSNEIILYALAFASALNYTYALMEIDGLTMLTGVMTFLRGIVTGAAAGLGIAKIAHAIPRASKTNRPYIMGAFVAFLLVTIPIISVVTYAKMSGASMATLPLQIRVIVAIATGVLIDALTAGVAFASGKLEADDKPAEAKPSEPKAPKIAEVVAPIFVCPVCKRECKSQNALNAHMSKHKAIAIDTALLMQKEIKP